MVLTLSAETTESKFELGRGRTVVHLQFYRIECGRGFGSIHEKRLFTHSGSLSKCIENEVKMSVPSWLVLE